MKKIYIILFLSCLSASGFTQNLVPNPGFEDFTSCPNDHCQIYKATGWKSLSFTPDYFNACDPLDLSVPSNMFGFQNAQTGNAYAGIGSDVGVYGSYRDYIGTHLITPLDIGKKYYINFKVSLANGSHYAINKIGAQLSTISYEIIPYDCNNQVANFIPNNHAQVYNNSIISDTLNWTTIQGSFIADSVYQYLMIGNFFSDDSTMHVNTNLSGNIYGSYYYIDDVYLGTDSISAFSEYNSLSQQITIYPNPTTGKLIVSCNENNETYEYRVYSIYGNNICKGTLNSNESVIYLYDILQGTYYIQLISKNKIYIKKIIKTN